MNVRGIASVNALLFNQEGGPLPVLLHVTAAIDASPNYPETRVYVNQTSHSSRDQFGLALTAAAARDLARALNDAVAAAEGVAS